MTAIELTEKFRERGWRLSERMAHYILSGRRPSIKTAERLQEVTDINKLNWLFPEQFGKPYLLKKQSK